MSGEVQRKNSDKPANLVRPSWLYKRTGSGDDTALSQLEMLESCRNVLEKIANSQMLQCDVRTMIAEIRYSAERTRKALERIDRRLAKVEKLR